MGDGDRLAPVLAIVWLSVDGTSTHGLDLCPSPDCQISKTVGEVRRSVVLRMGWGSHHLIINPLK